VQQAREAARRSSCKSNLKQLGIALHGNHETFRSFPPGASNVAGWPAYLLSFLDQSPLYKSLNIDPRTTASNTNVENTTILSVFLCPSNSAVNQPGGLTYKWCRGSSDGVNNGMLPHYNSRWKAGCEYVRFRDVTDGSTSTMFVGETALGNARWGSADGPTDIDNQNEEMVISHTANSINAGGNRDFSSPHIGGAQFLAVDGAVHFVSENINGNVRQALSTRAGGASEFSGSGTQGFP
jgi:hypothetical protein